MIKRKFSLCLCRLYLGKLTKTQQVARVTNLLHGSFLCDLSDPICIFLTYLQWDLTCIYMIGSIKIHVTKIATKEGSDMSKECSLHRTAYQITVSLE